MQALCPYRALKSLTFQKFCSVGTLLPEYRGNEKIPDGFHSRSLTSLPEYRDNVKTPDGFNFRSLTSLSEYRGNEYKTNFCDFSHSEEFCCYAIRTMFVEVDMEGVRLTYTQGRGGMSRAQGRTIYRGIWCAFRKYVISIFLGKAKYKCIYKNNGWLV